MAEGVQRPDVGGRARADDRHRLAGPECPQYACRAVARAASAGRASERRLARTRSRQWRCLWPKRHAGHRRRRCTARHPGQAAERGRRRQATGAAAAAGANGCARDNVAAAPASSARAIREFIALLHEKIHHGQPTRTPPASIWPAQPTTHQATFAVPNPPLCARDVTRHAWPTNPWKPHELPRRSDAAVCAVAPLKPRIRPHCPTALSRDSRRLTRVAFTDSSRRDAG